MSRGHGTLNVVNNKAYIVVSLPVTVFSKSAAAPSVADGILTAKELKANETVFREAIKKGLKVKTEQAESVFSTILLNLPKGGHHEPDRSAELTAMIVAPLSLTAGKIGPIDVINMLWAKDAQQLKLKATVTPKGQAERSELFELTPKAAQHRFFDAPAK